jgi:hypothetical protein
MRTTLDIESDVLAAVRELARQQDVAMGIVMSRLVREALSGRSGHPVEASSRKRPAAGFRPFPSRGVIVTNEMIDKLRDNEGV